MLKKKLVRTRWFAGVVSVLATAFFVGFVAMVAMYSTYQCPVTDCTYPTSPPTFPNVTTAKTMMEIDEKTIKEGTVYVSKNDKQNFYRPKKIPASTKRKKNKFVCITYN